jgi:hypothetical protein
MVTQTIETGAQAPPYNSKTILSKIAYIVGLGCCMNERKPKTNSPISLSTPTTASSRPPLSEIKIEDMNWSTSTLGLETGLTVHRSEEDPSRGIPLSSFEFYPPTPTSPPAVARAHSRPHRRESRPSGTESPVITITDYDIAAGGTTPSTGESQREQEERKQRKKQKNQKKAQKSSDRGKISTVRAWSQIDPIHGMYQADREREQRLSRATTSTVRQERDGRYSDIRAFDFMSYGGWIVI